METTEGKKARPWWFSRGLFWGVLLVLGGLACFGHALIVPASSHDEVNGRCPTGPCTTDNAPWAWALGGGVLVVMGIGRVGYARYTYAPQDDNRSAG